MIETKGKRSLSALFLSILLFMCSSCNDDFHEFRSIVGEWSKRDTLSFSHHNRLGHDCTYNATLELRCTQEYPYKDLWLYTEFISVNGGYDIDTVHCDIFADDGSPKGATAGMLRQISIPFKQVVLSSGDSLIMRVVHIMDDERLPGVSDVGLRLSHCGRHQFSEN